MVGVRITKEDLINRFTYHPPTVEQGNSYVKLRQQGLVFAALIVDLCPPGRQTSLAITAIEEAVMRANAAIAQDTPPVMAGDQDMPAGVGG